MLNLSSYFSKVRILDGGMGQELLAKGLVVKGSLWSASAMLDEKYHKLIIDTHLDFIKAGAEVIVTNTFGARRVRMHQNNSEKYFDYANKKAAELAIEAKKISKKKILIAGSLPAQNDTYQEDKRDTDIIKKNFYDQARLLGKHVDFFYLDVMSSGRECDLAIKATENLNLPFLIGLHIRKNGKLPSGETITEVFSKYRSKKWIGVITACVSPEFTEKVAEELKNLGLPFGFKINAWHSIPDNFLVSDWKENSIKNGDPAHILGKRKDITPDKFYDFSKKLKKMGATILGGCCEIGPSHISKIASLKN